MGVFGKQSIVRHSCMQPLSHSINIALLSAPESEDPKELANENVFVLEIRSRMTGNGRDAREVSQKRLLQIR